MKVIYKITYPNGKIYIGKEIEYIRFHKLNNPKIGYNQFPKFKNI